MNPLDTRAVDLSSSDDVFAPRLAEYWRKLEKTAAKQPETTESSDFGTATRPFTARTDWGETAQQSGLPASAVHRVAFHSVGLKPRLQALLAATWLDFVTFSGGPNQTHQIESTHLIRAIQQRRKASVSVSERLRVPREKALATTLLSPSGAYLSWLDMDLNDARI